MPTVVFPDTREGHEDWQQWDKSESTRPWFCSHYSGEHRTGKQGSGLCRTRERNAHPKVNACERCVAGFLWDFNAMMGDFQGTTDLIQAP
jgi:hypothetical protein